MSRKKVFLVFGTRPEAIKMAPLVKEFEKDREEFETVVAVTAQHREMLDQVLRFFEIVPDYDLDIMKKGQDLFDVTTKVLAGIRDILAEVCPDIVFVHGDTTTSTAAALAAFYKQIPVAHVEAGLRTYNKYSPWPEEMNRQLTGRLATYNFAPTSLNRENLLHENIHHDSVFVTGNTVIDSLHWVLHKIGKTPNVEESVQDTLAEFGLSKALVNSWDVGEYGGNQSVNSMPMRKLVLITGHRRENFGDGFLNICHVIKELASRYPDADFVYPMHMNPNVRSPIRQVFGSYRSSSIGTNVHFIEPLDYQLFVYLMNKSFLVLTDSGGIQEEAPGLGKPVLVMRDTTERPEALEAGTVRLVGTNKELIISEVSRLLTDRKSYRHMANAHNPYGDGKACERIVETVRRL